MCILCTEIAKQNMTIKEVARAFMEYQTDDAHIGDLVKTIHDNYDKTELLDEVAKIMKERVETL